MKYVSRLFNLMGSLILVLEKRVHCLRKFMDCKPQHVIVNFIVMINNSQLK